MSSHRRSWWSRILVGVMVGALSAACAGQPGASPGPEGSPPAAPTPAGSPPSGSSAADIVIPRPADGTSFAIGHSEVDINDLPTKMTVDRLNQEGWDLELLEFSAIDLLNQALSQGTVKITNGSLLDPLRAIQAGANVSWAMENNQGEYVFITRTEYPDCESLDGKIYGMHGETSSSSLAGKRWLEDCGATPQIVIIPGGDNRVVALINGQLDATVAQLFDWLTLVEQAPDDFHLLDTGDLFTTISGSAFWVNKDWTAENEDVAVAFLAEQLKTFRMVHEDPSLMADAIGDALPDYPADLALPTVTEYINIIGAWPQNGGDRKMVEDAIAFFSEDLDPNMSVEDAADTSLLEQALEIVGRVEGSR